MSRQSFQYISYGHDYEDLPMEILVHVFEYLHPSDRIIAGLVCQRWMEASQHPNFIQDYVLNFSGTNFSDETSPVKDLLESFRTYVSIRFFQVEFGQTEKFWKTTGNSIQEVSIRNCDIREKTLTFIIKSLLNLRTLRIEACRELLMPGRLFETEPEKDKLRKSLKTVQNLSLANNRYLSDALFNRFANLMPNIERLDLSGCHISFHKGLYRKFYPASQIEPSESVLTFLQISSYIETQASKIKYLNFSATLIDGSSLEVLAQVPQLKLECITLRQCDQLINHGIVKLVEFQSNLVSLDLSFSVRITDHCVIAICRTLPRLKILKLRRCRALTDLSIKELITLEELNVLDISECENVTGIGVIEGIASKTRLKLKELYVSALNICEKSVIKITEAFPNLLILDLSCCINSVNDLCLQMIFKKLLFLRHLNIEMCDKVSDAGITGLSMSEEIERHTEKLRLEEEERQKISEVEAAANNNESFSQLTLAQKIQRALEAREQSYSLKISLGSKAEDEIKNDAKRKKAMEEMCEMKSLDISGSGHSLAELKGLRVLKLSGCNRLTDVSLKFSFKLLELKELSLARCYQISIEGLKSLVNNCPSLEILDISECDSINDKAIELITEKLYRLTSLTLERCIQLTDFSLDYIAINCKNLKHLDVRGCRSMCAEPNLRVANLTSLRHVIMSKPGPYVSQNFEPIIKKPRPPPLPNFRL